MNALPTKSMKTLNISRISISFASLCLSTIFLSCDSKVDKPSETPAGLHVPDGYAIEKAALPGMVSHPYFATLDLDGRLFVIESSGKTTSTEDMVQNPTFMVLLLEDRDGDGVFDQRKVFADKIPYPMGSYFYRGSLYVTAPGPSSVHGYKRRWCS